jgi:hypothetical protein
VDGIDALRFVLQYRQGSVGGQGDFDKDGDVDGADLQVFASRFGRIGWDAYEVRATATDEDGTYTSNTLPVLDPPLPENAGDLQSQTPVQAEAYVPDLGRVTSPSAAPEATMVLEQVVTPPNSWQGNPAMATLSAPILSSGGTADWGWRYERPNFFRDPVLSQIKSEGPADSSGLRDSFNLFDSKPWSPSSSWSLVDLSADYDDGGLFDLRKEKKTRKAKSEPRAPWVEAFVSDLRGLEGSRSVNDDIRIVLSEEEEAEEK